MGPPTTEKLCKAKETVSRRKLHHTDWESIFTNNISDRELISKIYKDLKKLDASKQKTKQNKI